jgi:hypothetical protein
LPALSESDAAHASKEGSCVVLEDPRIDLQTLCDSADIRANFDLERIRPRDERFADAAEKRWLHVVDGKAFARVGLKIEELIPLISPRLPLTALQGVRAAVTGHGFASLIGKGHYDVILAGSVIEDAPDAVPCLSLLARGLELHPVHVTSVGHARGIPTCWVI